MRATSNTRRPTFRRGRLRRTFHLPPLRYSSGILPALTPAPFLAARGRGRGAGIMPPVSLGDGDAHPADPTQPVATNHRRGPWQILRWFMLLAVTATLLAALVGDSTGQSQRRSQLEGSLARAADEQFQLGLEDLQARRYELARQRFEYVIQTDPSYPNAAQRLAEALVGLNVPLAPFAA